MRKIQLTHEVWEIDESTVLGAPGGFGRVHPGTDSSGRRVAIKVLNEGVGDASLRELEFAKAYAGRKTRHVIPILDSGVDSNLGQSCIVMARADGNLRERLTTSGAFSEPELADVLIQIAQGLLETGDWIHRDLKPENVLRCDGRWQIADFGIGRLAEASTASHTMKHALTPQYASPEQWNHVHATHATDIYALGCIAVELLSLKPPFLGPATDDFARQHRMEMPVILIGSPPLRSLVTRMLSKPQVARPIAEDVIRELRSLVNPPRKGGDGATRLAQADSTVAQVIAREESARATAQAAELERRELAAHATGVLRGIAEQLFAEIEKFAPSSRLSRRRVDKHETYEVTLGTGILIVTLGQFAPVKADLFAGSKWDVVAGDVIIVRSPKYTRGASLWFKRPRASAVDVVYRWHEVGYMSLTGYIRDTPFALPPNPQSVEAASQVVGVCNFANQPRPIDGDQVEEFCERWMGFLADAAQGRLERPSHFPEP
jgi:serine/threonine protein kinase